MGLNAVRSMLGIATRGAADSSYNEALAIGREVAPQLFDPASSLLAGGQEPAMVREYRQRAEAQAVLAGRVVTPIELLDRDIAEYDKLSEAPGGARDQLRRGLSARVRAREWFEERMYSEHNLIRRDVHTAHRPELPSPQAGDRYVEYALPFDRALRIRVLHPDRPEHSTGADLVYEFCDQELHAARLAFVQYKMWDGHTLRFSDAPNLSRQLERLQALCCKDGLCDENDPPESAPAYRLPFCAAFLRPTDRLQRPDSTLISSGVHVPVCVALTVSLDAVGGRALKREPIRGRAVSQRLFEELFNRNMLGSRWLPYEHVEALYRQHRILDAGQRIVVHAQEFTARRLPG
jgi:hypothetical protein